MSIYSLFVKFLEQILAGRINKYPDKRNKFGQEQEGFRTKRNTVRSLYRLHLSLERAEASNLSTALLYINLKKNTIWIIGLLYKLSNYRNNGRMFRILEAFLRMDIKATELNGDPCFIKSLTKSLGMVIDNLLTYRQHAETTAEKANRKWITVSSFCNNIWSLTIPTLILLYKISVLPLILYASTIWFDRNRCSMQRVKNSFIRLMFNRSYSPNTEKCQLLLGVPPIDILSMSININFLTKVNLQMIFSQRPINTLRYYDEQILLIL